MWRSFINIERCEIGSKIVEAGETIIKNKMKNRASTRILFVFYSCNNEVISTSLSKPSLPFKFSFTSSMMKLQYIFFG